jgi:alpha-glucosidase
VWLSPVTCSPNRDWGYDVSDYRDIDPDYGMLSDLDTLVREAGARGIRVLMDLVPNHTSNQHAWFVDAASGRDAAHRDYYVWADPKPDGSLPNNWVSIFGGPAWELDEASGQYYLHNFEAQQPDLNWWNEDVGREFDEIVRFWWDRGVAGFRIDVCNVIIKDALLRDNPPATEDDDFETQMFGQRSVYNANRPEVHEVVRRWRLLADGYDEPRLLIGETPVPVDKLAEFYGNGSDELGLAFNFNFISAPFRAPDLRAIVEETEAALPPGAWPAWTGSNHDMFRFPTRWAEDDPLRVRLALLMLLSLRGTPVLYEGDEIGMANVALAQEDLRDPLGVRFYPYY